MSSGLAGVFKGIADAWNGLGRVQKGIVAGAGAFTLLGLLLLTGVGLRPSYAPLFTRLSPQDAGDVVAALDEKGVRYQLDDGGGTILVEKDEVYKTRLMLASAGLPRGGVVGFEIVDQSRFGATDFERRLGYVRGLQGELARTIMQLSEVEQARVHVVLPEESLFVSERKPATAAVFLKLKPTVRLEVDQVKGIVNLVSRSVENLKPEDVVIVDSHGRVLSADLDDAGGAAAGLARSRLETQRGFEKDLEKSLKAVLEPVFGPGNVVARINADLDFDEKTVDKQLFQPVQNEEGIIRSVTELEEYFKGTGSTPGGVPGVESNIPGYQAAGTPGDSEYQKREITQNLEMNEVKESLVVAPGTVNRLSVAVVVNRKLTGAEQQAVEKMVAAAIGFDLERRDQITVLGQEFDTTMAQEMKSYLDADAAAQKRDRIVKVALDAFGALAALVAGLVVLRWLRKRPVPEQVVKRQKALLAEKQEEVMGVEDQEHLRLRREIERLANKDPETVATLVRSWMTEG